MRILINAPATLHPTGQRVGRLRQYEVWQNGHHVMTWWSVKHLKTLRAELDQMCERQRDRYVEIDDIPTSKRKARPEATV